MAIRKPTALRFGALTFASKGTVVVKVGDDDPVELPITAERMESVTAEFLERKPEPRWEAVPFDEGTRSRLGLSGREERFFQVLKTEDPTYARAVAAWSRDLTRALAASALDLPVLDESGADIPASDYARRAQALARMGMTIRQFEAIANAAALLQTITEADRKRFLSAPSAMTSGSPGTTAPAPETA